MSVEFERKFLIDPNEFLLNKLTLGVDYNCHERSIQQWYLSTDGVSVRLRKVITGTNEHYYITFKGEGTVTRPEVELLVQPKAEAIETLISLSNKTVRKMRWSYWLSHSDYVGIKSLNVDLFDNGLWLAEFEVKSEDVEIPQFSWLGEEVTGQEQYYSQNIAK